MFVWYTKERSDLDMIHDKLDVLTDDKLILVWKILKASKHACKKWSSPQIFCY